MRKPKIYLDTSVISHLDSPDAPEKMADTLRFWNKIVNGEYEIVISSIVALELDACEPVKRAKLYEFLQKIPVTLVELNDDIQLLANKLVEFGVLSEKHLRDRLHIAVALFSQCDVIVSWNFRHIVNYKTMRGVRVVAISTGYCELSLCTPTIMIEGGAADDE